jgi:hypothetical protein
MKRESSPGGYWAGAEAMSSAIVDLVVNRRNSRDCQDSAMVAVNIDEICILDSIRGEQ